MKCLAGFIAVLGLLVLSAFQGLAAPKLSSLCEVSFPGDAPIEWDCLKLTSKDTPERLFGTSWQDVLRFNRMDRRHFYGGMSIKVPRRLEDVTGFTPLPAFYPEAEADARFILVDQSEMFLGAYEHGILVRSFPAAVGIEGHRVPGGEFRIDAIDRRHTSNLYTMEEIGRRYPMHYALRFFRDTSLPATPSYYIHGRDVPGYPASHGCIGLYDEEMQIEYYGAYDRKVYGRSYHPLEPSLLEGAQWLYRWVVGRHADPGGWRRIGYGPRVMIIGTPPL
jgi:L,D-transpeptidase catalytic domain